MRNLKSTLFLLTIGCLLLFNCQRNISVEPNALEPQSSLDRRFNVTLKEVLAVASEHYHLKSLGSSAYISARQSAATSNLFMDKVREVKNTKIIKDGNEELIHVVNYKDNKGFVLVAGDKRFTPVLAYSDDGEFGSDSLLGVRDWLLGVKSSIKKMKAERKEQRPQEKSLWLKYLKRVESVKGARSANEECPACDYYEFWSTGRTTDPIARWSQSYAYSFYTPNDGGCTCSHKAAGCGPVAMAIIMRRYRHPDMMMSFNGESMWLDDAGYDAMPQNWNQTGVDCGRPVDNTRRLSMLIRLNGSAANSGYGVFGNCNTWTLPSDIPNAFRSMGYSDGGWWDDLTYGHWQSILSDLRQGFPVLFNGTYKEWYQPNVYYANNAHIWVGDGYQRSTYDYQVSGYDEYGYWYCYCNRGSTAWISMNWGHGGTSNGEYLAYHNKFENYDSFLRALVHIRP